MMYPPLYFIAPVPSAVLGAINQYAVPPDLRQLAGLIVKNYAFSRLPLFVSPVQREVQVQLLALLDDRDLDARRTAAMLIGKMAQLFPAASWSDMMPPLLSKLELLVVSIAASSSSDDQGGDPSSTSLRDGTMLAIERICEDASARLLLLSLDDHHRTLDRLVPMLVRLMSHPLAAVRVSALTCCNCLLQRPQLSGSDEGKAVEDRIRVDEGEAETASSCHRISSSHPLRTNIPGLIAALSGLTADSIPQVRRLVCQSIVILASLHVEALQSYFPSICEFMVQSLLDTEESVAMECCDYWSALLERVDTKMVMRPYLNVLINNIISRLYLTDEQLQQERVDEEEESSGERQLNLQPVHHRVRSAQSDAEAKESSELSSKWTLRKQSALLLDTIALSFPPMEVLAVALPRIQSCFQAEGDELLRESGMLALGALSTGCIDAMLPYLPDLCPFFLQNLEHPLPEMRSITCWVASRYCSLLGRINITTADQSASPSGIAIYHQLFHALRIVMFDSKPKVQVAACSALCLFVEHSFYVTVVQQSSEEGQGEVNILQPFLPQLFADICRAFEGYGHKASLILIDMISTLADTLKDAMRDKQLSDRYLPILVGKLGQLDLTDMRLFPLLECFTSLLPVIGLDAQSHVFAIYRRCLDIATNIFRLYSTDTSSSSSDNDHDLPSKDFAICAIDVLSSLNEGLDSLFVTLAEDSKDVVFYLLFSAIDDNLPELRQAGFSLAGELCKHSFSMLSIDTASHIVHSALSNLNTTYPLVCNNAAWTIGELSLQVQGDFWAACISPLATALVLALQAVDFEQHLKVNIAVTIGRLAIATSNTPDVAQLADEFFADYCNVLALDCPFIERCQATRGLLVVSE